MTVLLAALFFLTAALYASVGFGGGSTYSALLVLNGVDYRLLPVLALACNIIVVTGGVVRFQKSGDLPLKRMYPFMIASIPAATLGGRLPISETLFVGLLGAALLASGLRLATQADPANSASSTGELPLPFALSVGGAIGLLSGIVGIGGGIFLAPILYMMRWGSPRAIAAASSLFILVNSLAGLVGQSLKLQQTDILPQLLPFWPLFIAVLVGGQIGSWAASASLQPKFIKRFTAILILYVAVRLLYRWGGLAGLV